MLNSEQIMVGINSYLIIVGQWLLSSGLRIIAITLILIFAIRSASWFSSKFFNHLKSNDYERVKRIQTLQTMISVVWKTLVLAMGVMLILGELGINLGPIIATAGIVGLAVGFGSQELVKDVISGFLILLEDQVRVGDVVDLDGKGGLVEKVNIRTIILRDLDGSVHYVRNGNVKVVTNKTKEYSFYVFDLAISYNNDVNKAIEILKEVDRSMHDDPNFGQNILQPLEIFGLDSFADSALIVKARVKTTASKQWDVGREFNARIKKAFDSAGIEIPYPQRTLYIRTEKEHMPKFNLQGEEGLEITQ